MEQDIRDMPFIGHDDVIALNFIRNPCPYVFRRHFRQGLRSHIMEVLKPAHIQKEAAGTVIDGHRWYPRARPLRIFRIFRTRLKTLANALDEIGRVKILEYYLAPVFLARSEEFIVDYAGPDGRDILLCGFQEFVEGEILDPWSALDPAGLMATMYDRLRGGRAPSDPDKARWIDAARAMAALFIVRIKQMIAEKKHLPDLAGVGNLVMVASGEIKLVDLNNISGVALDADILLDDRGYPVCDKSIEALALLERNLLNRPVDTGEAIYRKFLDPQRMKDVRDLEAAFHRSRPIRHS
jgi:hypothetical protein